jgi:hypothetical protein
MEQKKAANSKLTDYLASTNQNVPLFGRLAATWKWMSYHMSKNDPEEKFGVDHLRCLHAYYREYIPMARESGNEKRAAKYEEKLQNAHRLLVRGYATLADHRVENNDFKGARRVILRLKEELGPGPDQAEMDKALDLILAIETLRLAERGQADRVEERLGELGEILSRKRAGVTADIVRQKAQNA